MADDTEWFEALTVEEAKEARIIVGLWVGRVVTLFALLCIVANVAWRDLM